MCSLVLGRTHEVDCVGLEEVDSLQTELETLLAAAAKRMRLLQAELELLDDWLDKGVTSGAGIPGSIVSGLPGNKDKTLASSTSTQQSSAQQVFRRILLKLILIVGCGKLLVLGKS